MEKHLEIKEIYRRFLSNEATAAELDQLFDYFKAEGGVELRKLIAIELNANVKPKLEDAQRVMHLDRLQMKINSKIDARDNSVVKPVKYPMRVYFKSSLFKIAASLLLVAFLSFVVYNYFSISDADKIKPGGNYATLLTEDGKQIDLKTSANTKVATIQDVIIRKTADGQIIYIAQGDQRKSNVIWNSILTPLGGKYKVTLSDGSIVILNSDSKLEFPVGFHGAERRVKLTGEAYFEVTKDLSKPFIVVSGNGSTEVLGTKFNVSSYPEDGVIKTTLLEGKVRFSRNGFSQAAMLKPGEQAVLKGEEIQVSMVIPEDFMAWKDNRFIFKNEELSVVMRQLSRWYNVEIDYSTLPKRSLYANISADVNLAEVLRMLSVTSGLKFNVDGRRVSVMK